MSFQFIAINRQCNAFSIICLAETKHNKYSDFSNYLAEIVRSTNTRKRHYLYLIIGQVSPHGSTIVTEMSRYCIKFAILDAKSVHIKYFYTILFYFI